MNCCFTMIESMYFCINPQVTLKTNFSIFLALYFGIFQQIYINGDMGHLQKINRFYY